jgi:hypothetical protein
MKFTTAVATFLLSLGLWSGGSATLFADSPFSEQISFSSVSNELNPGDFVFVQQNSGRVSAVKPGNLQPQLLTQGGLLSNPNHVIIDAERRILTAERSSTPGIVRIDPVTGSQTLIASGSLLTRPVALAFNGPDSLVVANSNGPSDRKVVGVNLLTGVQTLIANLSLSSVQDIDVESSGKIIALDFGIFNSGGGRVVRIDPLTGITTTVASGGFLVNPSDLVIAPSGNFLLSNRLSNSNTNGSQLIEINAVTGAQRLITTMPREGWIAQESLNSLIYADFTLNTPLTRIDLTTGAKQAISNLSFGGTAAANITGLAMVPVPIPEPGLIAAGVLAGIVLLCAGRRGRKV